MAKSKKAKVVVEKGTKIPKGRSVWPFSDLRPPDPKTGDLSVFYVDADEHQAIRTAASRAMKSLNITVSVNKIRDRDHKEFGRIGVYRIK